MTPSERAKLWRKQNKEHYQLFQANRHLETTYGITLQDYNQMFTEQKGLCACCGQPETVKRAGQLKRLAVDHDSNTGINRGLLCMHCNTALGSLRHDIERIKKLLAYAVKYNIAPTKTGIRNSRFVQ